MEMVGFECVGHCEIDKYAHKSYAAMHNPKEDEWYGEDIRAVDPGELPYFDIIAGGFPCQSFSIAGSRGGFEDTRGTLFFEIARIIREAKPKLVFLENVRGLLNHDGGRTFGTILNTFWELGYDVEWQLLNSKDFGVPHNRERVFIVAYPRGTSGGKVFPIRGNGKSVIDERVDIADYRYDEGLRVRSNGISPCLRARNEGMATNDLSNSVYIIKKKLKENTKKGYVEAYPGDGIRLDHPTGTTGRGRVQSKMSPTLLTGANIGTLTENHRIRKLTPKECFRLQGFPDELFEKARLVNSDSQLYKQAGNSVTVNVIYEIAKRFKQIL